VPSPPYRGWTSQATSVAVNREPTPSGRKAPIGAGGGVVELDVAAESVAPLRTGRKAAEVDAGADFLGQLELVASPVRRPSRTAWSRPTQ
jgi:hypothetical protein